jgi:hypothetical protein
MSWSIGLRATPLTQYLQLVVEPTADEFINNPLSLRHYFLACAAIFHAIDRAARLTHKSPAHLRQVWANESADFKIVDISRTTSSTFRLGLQKTGLTERPVRLRWLTRSEGRWRTNINSSIVNCPAATQECLSLLSSTPLRGHLGLLSQILRTNPSKENGRLRCVQQFSDL